MSDCVPIEVKRGDSIDWSSVIVDSGSLAGAGFSGSTIASRGLFTDGTEAVVFNIQWLDANTGAYRMRCPASTTATFEPGTMIYADIQVTFPDGTVVTTPGAIVIKIVRKYT